MRDEKDQFWSQLANQLERGEPAFVAAVADHTRHSPGTRGAKMWVAPNGAQMGTVGGGAMEADILSRATDFLAGVDDISEIEILEHKRETGVSSNPSGLICAGRQTMAYWVARPADAEVYRRFANATERGEEMALVVVEGAADTLEEPVRVEESPVSLAEGPPMVYREHAVNRNRVAIVGGGHCGAALSRVMSGLGYHVTNIETRPDVFTFRENRWADERVVVEDYVEAAGRVRFPQLSHYIVMTSDFPSDCRALIGAADYDFPYVGVMGSSAKLKAIYEELAVHGVSGGSWTNFYAPVGLQMTSNTPEEIAISVAAQILRERETLFPWTRPSALGG